MSGWGDKGDDLVVPFIFVPQGAKPPSDWLADNPNPVRLSARFVPRRSNAGSNAERGPSDPSGAAPGDTKNKAE